MPLSCSPLPLALLLACTGTDKGRGSTDLGDTGSGTADGADGTDGTDGTGGGGDSGDSGEAGPWPAFDCAPDQLALLEGVGTIDQGGAYPSLLIAHGPQACPLLADEYGNLMVAIARYGEGRVLHTGHESMVTGPHYQEGDSTVLFLNALRWAGQGEAPVVGYDAGMEDVASWLAEAGTSVVPAGVADLGSVDVWLTMTYTERSEEDYAAIRDFVHAGGGLIQGGHAWYWGYSHENAAEEHMANQVLNPMGLTLTASIASAGEDAVPSEPLSPLYQATFALEAIARHERGVAELSAEEQDRAATTVQTALQHLPVSFDSYYVPAEAIVETLPEVMPSEADPVSQSAEPLQALVVTFWSRLASERPLDELPAPPQDFPGPVDSGAPRAALSATVLASYAGRDGDYWYSGAGADLMRSTGAYAAPGETVTLTVPAAWAGQGLRALVGAGNDSLWGNDEWSRYPEVTRAFDIEAASTEVGNVFGGPIYILVPAGLELGEGEVQIDGAVAMPWYRAGHTSAAEWQAMLEELAVPMVELETDSFVLTVMADSFTRDEDPADLMAFWEAVLDADADLAGISRDRVRPERFLIERQISAGWMHSGYPLMGYSYSAQMTDHDYLSTSGDWGAFHELGHNHQYGPWLLPGTTETTCNLWSVYVMETVVGVDRHDAHPAISESARQDLIDAYIAGGRDFWSSWSVWTALETYLELQEAFGWEFYQELNATYLAMPSGDRPTDDNARIQTWVIESSFQAGLDLTDFYEAWGFPIDPETADAVSELPLWTDHPLARR